ncbi:AraC family transcriptional regulator [Galbibacter sp. PAP.153]|uniref:helix-turn-helix domain-containing protein n=1 Tax=Galbibacter sp. PAP.153 TaxID=3104623 RepID=UPI003008F1E2
MEKKRRDFINCELINLKGRDIGFKEVVGSCISVVNGVGCDYAVYKVHGKYGKGDIKHVQIGSVSIQTCNLELEKDLVFYNETSEDFIHMSFLIEGEKIISLRGNNDVLNESQECYMARVEEFKGYVRLTGERPYREVNISFPYSYLQQRGIMEVNDFKSYNDNHLVHPMSNEILTILAHIQETTLEGVSKRLFLEAKLLELLALQLNNYKNGQIQKSGVNQDKILKKLYAAKQFMLENLDQNYSIKEMSRKMALNEYIFKKEFKRVFGCSVNEFYSDKKMNKAKELLKVTQLPIYEIAGEVGYKNATHFSAAFKRAYGKTPKQFRVVV